MAKNVFDSYDELEEYVLEQARKSLIQIQEQVYAIIDRFVKEYYAEYSPRIYERTYQLYRSLVKSDIRKEGNGYVCEVYFDVTRLNYEMKKFMQFKNEYGQYYNPFSYEANDDGWFYNKGHDKKKTLETAMLSGTHGGYGSGTAIWTDSMKIINRKKMQIFKKFLKQNGIPIK